MEQNENTLNIRVTAGSLLKYALPTIFSGVAGAAYATAAGYFLQSVIGVIFFFVNRKGSLYFVRPKFDGKALFKACSNGMSEMVGMLAVTFGISFPLAKPIALLFADGSAAVVQMSVRGMFIFAAAFLLMGFNLFASGFFTALNDGKTSAILSLFRTLIFLILPLVILPQLIGADGAWISLPAAEVLSVLLAMFFFGKYKSKYHYA